ncbi:MAG: DUF5714 domain-containing protein [Bacteroidota bacterium]
MDHKSDCLVCGKELQYLSSRELLHCHFCHEPFQADVRCADGHYIYDKCHSASAVELIERYCMRTKLCDPLTMARELMKSPSVKMHGPEHHFLVPAVMVTAYYNTLSELSRLGDGATGREGEGGIGRRGEKEKKIREARIRSEKVLGGFCGFYGACGAAIGTGIFISLVTGATPLATEGWMLSNLMTAQSLGCIASCGGPRCCKRDSFIAITEAIAFVKEHFKVNIEYDPEIKCEFHLMNRECLHGGCQYYDK